jgi:transcriptional regulator with GAF, ATPase, and Fis domain
MKQYTLRMIDAGTTKPFLLDHPLSLIGRGADNDIRIEAKTFPLCAAQIEKIANDYTVRSLGGTSLIVNGKKQKSALLQVGDRIEIASQPFLFDEYCSEPPALPDPRDATAMVESMHRFLESVGQEQEIKILLNKIIEIIFTIIGGTDAFVFTLDPDKNPRLFVSSDQTGHHQRRFSDTIVQAVLKKGSGIVVANALNNNDFNKSRSIVDLKLHSVLCCPLRVAGATCGVIYLGSRKPTESFDNDDLRTLGLYATVTAILINHVGFITQQKQTIKQLTHYADHAGIVGESKCMQDIFTRVADVALSDIAILLEGDTGTGKDVLAHYIHNQSARKARPMVVVNCSSLRGELLESELFGYRKGSFTGATADHDGLFAAAEGGTLFLDEIGEMGAELQAKLLRALESGRIRPVGATAERKVNVRIICATNRDLMAMVNQGSFRKDLYFRINQFAIKIPALCERGEDVILLAYYFLEKYKCEYPSKTIVDFHPDSLKFIGSYEWPGNVRELSSCIHRSVLSSVGPLATIEHRENTSQEINYELATQNFQKRLIENALRLAANNKEQAARLLGLSRSTFFRYLAEQRE